MKLDGEINSMLLTSMYVNLHVLKKEKHKLSDYGQLNLEMLTKDFNKLVKKLQEES